MIKLYGVKAEPKPYIPPPTYGDVDAVARTILLEAGFRAEGGLTPPEMQFAIVRPMIIKRVTAADRQGAGGQGLPQVGGVGAPRGTHV